MDVGIGILGITAGKVVPGGGNISSVVRLNFLSRASPGRRSTNCDIREVSLSSRGIWNEDENILFKVMPSMMVHVTMFFILSHAIRFIFKPLKQPRVVSYALAGIALGPSGFAQNTLFRNIFYSPRQMLLLNTLANVGMIYYTFIIGVKVDTGRILRAGKKAWAIGLSSSLPPLVAIVLLAGILSRAGSNIAKGSFLFRLAIDVSMSVFMNVAPMLEELNLVTTDLAQLAMSSSLLNDFIAWLYWVASVFMLRGLIYGVSTVISVFLILAFIVFVLRPVCKWIVRKTPEGKPVNDFYIKSMFLLPLVVAVGSDLGLGSPYLGCILIGLAIPEGPPLGSDITQRAELLVNTVFLPFFFLAVGSIVDVFSIKDWDVVIKFQSIIVFGYTVKILSTFLFSLACNLSFREALIITMMMDTRGVVDLIVFRGWYMHQVLTKPFLVQLVFSSLALTTVMSPLTKWLYVPLKSKSRYVRGHPLEMQSTSVHSELKILSCVNSESDVPGIITLVEASNPTDASPICLHVIHLLELVGRATPLLIPHKKHESMCKHNGCIRILNAFKNYCEGLCGRVSVQLFTMVAPFRNMHEGICRLAQDKRTPLVIVPFCSKDQSFVGESSALTKFNSKIQAISPCTVGIFVNKDTQKHLSGVCFSYRILVIFFGGEDDREALAYGARMAGHPGVWIKVLQIRMQNAKKCGMRDWALDGSLVDEFRTNNLKNPRASYLEVQLWDLEQAIEVIGSLEDNYDLIIIGKRPGMRTMQEEDMCALIKNPELGFIGDMLASSEFHGGKVSLLVMRHSKATSGRALGS